ncbi:MAG: hypothetical protein HC934_00435 [Acaryochloridaceae cyanobacterium SU_2_1]|nr:hypothetical protein [Acaryochloridaceae cyanobacterium SU_2_1]
MASPPSALQLAEQLAQQLTITSGDWHRLKGNRKARALEQAAAAMVFLLQDQTQEGLIRLEQAVGWLDRSISAPPCPTHGHAARQPSDRSEAENSAHKLTR